MVMSQRPSLPSSTHPTSPFQHPVSLQAFKSFIASPPPLFFLSCAVTGLWNTCIIAFLQKHYSRVIEASNTCQVFISELSSHSKYVERMSGVRLKILGVGVSLFSLFSKFLLKKEDGMDEGLFDEMQECLKALPSPCLSLAPPPTLWSTLGLSSYHFSSPQLHHHDPTRSILSQTRMSSIFL